MADVALKGTCALVATCDAYFGYIWCTEADIQLFLDAESIIDIGDTSSDTYAAADAIKMENTVVHDIVRYLSGSLVLSIYTPAQVLVSAAAMLTAARIGRGRMGASMGSDLAEWTDRYANQVWAKLQSIYVDQTLDNATARVVPLWKRLIMSKMRERSVVPNV